jgi:hypothetical protein
MRDSGNLQLLRLGLLLQLMQRARQVSPEELPFFIVNETHQLFPYHQAVLWECDPQRQGRVTAISGVPLPDRGAPYMGWLDLAIQRLAEGDPALKLHPVGPGDLPAPLAQEWAEWVPPQGLWIPLFGPRQALIGAMLLFRSDPWSEADGHIMGYLAGAYAQSLALRQLGPGGFSWRTALRERRRAIIAVLGAILLLLLVPVRQAVLAPAEAIPSDPTLIRAPFDGVVDRFYIEPNQSVRAGQRLLSLDPAQLQSRLKVAQETRQIAEAELLQATQFSFSDPSYKAKINPLQGKVEQQAAEIAYIEGLLRRIELKAAHDGLAIFDDPNDWLGRPVTIGQRILVVADPVAVALEIRLPAEDAIPLAPDAEVVFFANVAPDEPIPAHLQFASYRATLTPDNIMSYRLRAAFDEGASKPRIGYKGTAKVFGHRVPFLLWVLRRPIKLVRQWLFW